MRDLLSSCAHEEDCHLDIKCDRRTHNESELKRSGKERYISVELFPFSTVLEAFQCKTPVTMNIPNHMSNDTVLLRRYPLDV